MSDGLRIAYRVSGAGAPLLFLNGVGSVQAIWRKQVSSLSRRFRCITFDYRGYGESERPPASALLPGATGRQTISREALARDALAVLRAANVRSAHLCGCSLGGVLALECYRQAPQHIRSLILVDSFAHYPHGLETIAERLRIITELGIEAFADSRAPGVLKPGAALGSVAMVRQHMASIPLAVYLVATRATWTGDYRRLLPKIARPALVVWGENDTVIAPRALSDELVRRIPAAEFVMIPNAGHLPNIDNPRRFNAVLARFVDSVERAAVSAS